MPTLPYSTLAYLYICAGGKYKDAINSTILKGSIKETEDYFRHLFATQRNHPDIQNPHLMLIDVFKSSGDFKTTAGDKEEVRIR